MQRNRIFPTAFRLLNRILALAPAALCLMVILSYQEEVKNMLFEEEYDEGSEEND